MSLSDKIALKKQKEAKQLSRFRRLSEKKIIVGYSIILPLILIIFNTFDQMATNMTSSFKKRSRYFSQNWAVMPMYLLFIML